MRPVQAVLIIIATIWWHMPAHSEPAYNTGNYRMAGCAAIERHDTAGKMPSSYESVYNMGICTGQLNTALYFLKQSCLPDNVTVGQFAAVVNKFLRANPQARNEDINEIMVVAAAEVWPCAKQKGDTF